MELSLSLRLQETQRSENKNFPDLKDTYDSVNTKVDTCDDTRMIDL